MMQYSEKLPISVPKKMQNMKCYAYIAAFSAFQIIFVGVCGIIMMRMKTPAVRLRSVAVRSLDYCASDDPFFNMTLAAEVVVRNKNFGHFRFDPSRANVTYKASIVGHGDITKARATAMGTRRMNVTIQVSSAGVLFEGAKLSNELSSENVTLTTLANVTGEATWMNLKNSKTAQMNCSMTVHLPNHLVYDLASL